MGIACLGRNGRWSVTVIATASTRLDGEERYINRYRPRLSWSIKQPSLDPKTVTISGTQFHDTLAPFDAVMKVRDGLSNEAVARICDFINQGQGCGDKTGSLELPLQIVQIDAEDYRLPLGMELSRTTFDLIDWMLGGPERCDRDTGSEMSRRNSCVMKHVGDRLSQM